MNSADHEPSRADIADLLAQSPFAGQLRSGAAVLVASGEPPRVIFANEAAHAIFRTKDLQQISAAAFIGTSPGARRLRQLASARIVDAPPKLELLRFYFGRLPLQLALFCAHVMDSRGEPFLVAAAPAGDVRNVGLGVDASQAPVAPTSGSLDSATLSPPPDQISRKGRATGQRFLWSVDQNFRFDAPAEALVTVVGDEAPRAAESLDALKARIGLDASGEFANALARRTTFGSLRLAWPHYSGKEQGGEATVLVLSGAPIFDRDRHFLGYRGFGVFTGESAPFEAKRQIDEQRQVFRGAPPFEPTAQAPTLAPWGAIDGGIIGSETDAAALAPAEETSSSPPSSDEMKPRDAPPPAEHYMSGSQQASPERSAEIVALRAPGQPYAGGPNVVPIRPGALRHFLLPDEGARRGADDESVELTTHERDAFREIARALGAKIRDHRDSRAGPTSSTPDDPASRHEGEIRDVIDLGAPTPQTAPAAPENPAPAASGAETLDADSRADNRGDLLDQLPIGALVARGGEALYLNRTLLDLLGYRDLSQFRAKSGLLQIFNGRRPEQMASPGESVALSLRLADGETTAVDGQVRAVEWDGEPATLISLRRPIEAELAAKMRTLEFDAQRRESEARELSAVLDTATDGVVMLDSRGKILSLNRPGQALFGLDQRDIAGEDFLTLFSPESRETVTAYFDGLRTNGLASLLNDGREALGRERQGRVIPLFITLGRVDSLPEAKFCAVLRDMTQWKTIERDLEEARGQAEKASALKSEFLAKISHEIRTPLNAILGFAEVILDERFGPVGNERYKEYLKDIHSSGTHVMSLINDLLDLSKIEAGKLDLDFAAVDANSIIQECVSLMQPQAAQERIIMRLSLFDKLPRIIADERSVRQIMLNLMSNAVKFNEPGGQVIVSTAMNESGQAVIRVRDTGIGMSDAEISIALEPFRRISTARQTGGTGLGLPLTKALAEANRAGFSIKSRKEQGTLVEVAFPTVQAAAAQ